MHRRRALYPGLAGCTDVDGHSVVWFTELYTSVTEREDSRSNQPQPAECAEVMLSSAAVSTREVYDTVVLRSDTCTAGRYRISPADLAADCE